MAMAPKVQKDAVMTRRYSSTPVPTSLGDLVRNAPRASNHAMVKDNEKTGTTYIAELGGNELAPNRTNCARLTAASTTRKSVIRNLAT